MGHYHVGLFSLEVTNTQDVDSIIDLQYLDVGAAEAQSPGLLVDGSAVVMVPKNFTSPSSPYIEVVGDASVNIFPGHIGSISPLIAPDIFSGIITTAPAYASSGSLSLSVINTVRVIPTAAEGKSSDIDASAHLTIVPVNPAAASGWTTKAQVFNITRPIVQTGIILDVNPVSVSADTTDALAGVYTIVDIPGTNARADNIRQTIEAPVSGIISVSDYGYFFSLDLSDLSAIYSFELNTETWVAGYGITVVGEFAYAVGYNGSYAAIFKVDLESGHVADIYEYTALDDSSFASIVYDEETNSLFVGGGYDWYGYGTGIHRVDLDTMEITASFTGYTQSLHNLSVFSLFIDGDYLYSTSSDDNYSLLKQNKHDFSIISYHEHYVHTCGEFVRDAVLHDGIIYTTYNKPYINENCESSSVVKVDETTFDIIDWIDGNTEFSVSIAYGPDGNIYFGTQSNGVFRVDPETMTITGTVLGGGDGAQSLTFDNDGFLIAQTDYRYVYKIDIETDTVVASFMSPDIGSGGEILAYEDTAVTYIYPITEPVLRTLISADVLPGIASASHPVIRVGFPVDKAITDGLFLYEATQNGWIKAAQDDLLLAGEPSGPLGIAVSDLFRLQGDSLSRYDGTVPVSDAITLEDIAERIRIVLKGLEDGLLLEGADTPQLVLMLADALQMREMIVPAGRMDSALSDVLAAADEAIFSWMVRIVESLHFEGITVTGFNKGVQDSFSVAGDPGAQGVFARGALERLGLDDRALIGIQAVAESVLGLMGEPLKVLRITGALQDDLSSTDTAFVSRKSYLSPEDVLAMAEDVLAGGSFTMEARDVIRLDVTIVVGGEAWECFVLNTPNFHPSVYTGFAFNSFCTYEGRTFAAGEDGIHEIAPVSGEGVSPGVVMSETDFDMPNRKRIRKAYLGVSGDKPVMAMTTESGERIVYEIQDNDTVHASRALSGRRWVLSVIDFDEIDFISLVPVILARGR